MITRAAIDDVLRSHAAWKQELHDAIASQQSDFTVETLKRDDLCELGKWLRRLTPEDKQGVEIDLILLAHAQFHEAAAEILALALEGKTTIALRLLEFNGTYGLTSARLTGALNEWKARLPP